MTGRTGVVAAATGAVAVLVGFLVLRSRAAEVEIGWFSYDGPPSPELMGSLVGWNLVRTVGALLVLTGLLVLAHLLGALVAARGRLLPGRLTGALLALAGVLVVGGLVAFVALGLADRGEATISISKLTGPPLGFRPAWSVWTRGQTSAALVVATGLVLGAVTTGLRRRDVPGRGDLS